MFGVLYYTEDGMMFQVYETLSEAQARKASAETCLGWRAIVFDYDKEQKTYLEFYE